MGRATKYNTKNQLNKPIRMMGLSSLQLFGIIGVVGLSVVISVTLFGLGILGSLVVAAFFLLPAFFIAGKLSTEHKKGHPDFMKSYMTFMSTPRKIIDKKGVLSMIYQESNQKQKHE